MNLRLKILVSVLVVCYLIMELVVHPASNGRNIIFSVFFGAGLIGLVYWRASAEQPKNSGDNLKLQSAVASFGCSVFLIVVIQVTLIVLGLDFFDLIAADILPFFILASSGFFYPFCWWNFKRIRKK
jgi:hypothetical protein